MFCFLVTPNHAWNLNDLPTRRSDGSLTARPVAAVDLHYLVTCYGDDRALEPQRLLGRVVVALKATSVLTRDVVTAALDLYDDDRRHRPSSPTPTSPTRSSWSSSRPTPLSLEEMSKLWGVLDTPLPAVAHLPRDGRARRGGRHARRSRCRCGSGSSTVTPASPPHIASLATDPPDQPILTGTTLVINGSGLRPDHRRHDQPPDRRRWSSRRTPARPRWRCAVPLDGDRARRPARR